MSINAKSVEFHQCHAKPHSISFYHNIKENERNLCQDLLTIENTNSDLRVHALRYANELLVRVRLSFQKLVICKLAQHGELIRKKCLRVQTTINTFPFLRFFFFTTISTSKKMCFFFPERELKKALHDTLTRAAWCGL